MNGVHVLDSLDAAQQSRLWPGKKTMIKAMSTMKKIITDALSMKI